MEAYLSAGRVSAAAEGDDEATLTDRARYVQREARPISLRQLTFFGRTLTESRLLSSANYVRTELPTRLAHRIRDMQTLPYVVVTNHHMSHVYNLYYKAFEALRRVPEVKNVEDNDRLCKIIRDILREHLSVIPRLAMGVIECEGVMESEEMDVLMNTLLRSVRRPARAPRGCWLTHAAEDLSPCDRRAAPRSDGNLPLAVALSGCQALAGDARRPGGRGLPALQCS